MKHLLYTLGFSGLQAVAFAATYYVDQQHPLATDTNAGTAAAPFRHVQAAVDRALPGDTVLVHGGTYREMISFKTNGTPEQRITLAAVPGETVVVKGSVVVKGWERITAKMAGLTGEYPRENLWIKRGWTRENIYPADEPHLAGGPRKAWLLIEPRWAFWKDAVLEGAGWITFALTRDELQEDRMLYDGDQKTVTIWLPPDIDPNANGIEVCVRPLLLMSESPAGLSYVTVRGLQWRHANTRNLANWAAVGINGHSVFEDNIVSWCDYCGLSFSGERAIVRRNVLAWNGSGGMGGSGREHLIEDNKVFANNLDRHDTFNTAGGGKSVFLDHCVFRRHEAAFNNGPGIWLDIANNYNVFESCYFHHNHGAGIFLEISHSNIIRNCIFAWNTEMPGGMRVQFYGAGRKDTKERERHYEERGDMGWGAYNSSSEGTKWLNNLFYANQNAGLVCEGGWRGDGSVKELKGQKPEGGSEAGWTTTKNITILNNLFVGNGGVQLIIRSSRTDADCTGNASDYNLFDLANWTGAKLASESYGGPSYERLDGWRQGTGWDRHSLSAGSELTFPAAGDFRPTLMSPAADRGTALLDVPVNYLGNARPVGKGYDIGPFERFSVLAARPSSGLPPGLTFTPVGIKALLNRALADDKAEDGLGGWADQGPACDLSDFARVLPVDAVGKPKAGTVRLADVNFQVEYPLSVLVLNPNNTRPGTLPDRATIPVNGKADWLCFLHGTAWGGSWDYLVRYEDGSEQKIEVRTPLNMRDWSQGSDTPFRFETNTVTAAAWVGTSGSFPKIAIYRTAWANPKPAVQIRDIEMVGISGVPALLAVTLGKQ